MNAFADGFFRLLADPTRLRCLVLLQREGELCVCELTHALGEIQPKISRHLALLRDGQLVLDRRDGQWVHYRIHPELPDWAREVLASAAAGLSAQMPFLADRRNLAGMPNRPATRCCA
ncbi:MAG: metalloregulator ArsR/SmtB family transcription factor [Thiohalomonadaceae bacterium]